jgi:hypothetical protein
MSATTRRDHIREMLADLKLPGALEAVDEILADVDRGTVTASEALERVLGAQITLRNNRRLQTAMRSSRLPAIKTLKQFDFAFQPSVPREQIESLHELGFVKRRENVIFLGPPRRRQNPSRPIARHCSRGVRPTSLLRYACRAHRVARTGQSCRSTRSAAAGLESSSRAGSR